MRTTLNLDDELIERARLLTGIREKAALLHAGLEAFIARTSAQRLATLGGTERRLAPIRDDGWRRRDDTSRRLMQAALRLGVALAVH